ncbi:hypothetical protein EJ110_NYTH42309 [Nymphaea thermarum]|nr:hypothetical protein EJ110_NYTH42309 [Nymphaea thermarum]
MGRSPCCDESGLKKGPWTPEEDSKLIDYIQKHRMGVGGHFPNMHVLPALSFHCSVVALIIPPH